MHFSQGWVQFGYRFSNDVVPFALLLVAARHRAPGRPAARRWAMPLAMGLIVLSIAVNAWGVAWGGCSDGDAAIVALAAPDRGRQSSPSRPNCLALLPGLGLLGHRRAADRGTVLGTAHPTGYPTYILLGWLGEPCCSAVRRAGLPDEPVRGDLPRGGRGRDGRPRPGADALDRPLGVAAGLGLALTQHRLASWAPTPRPTPSTWSWSSILLRLLVAWDGPPSQRGRRPRRVRATADRLLVAAASSSGWRSATTR